jgi:uncharacterized protein (DUF2235 family)
MLETASKLVNEDCYLTQAPAIAPIRLELAAALAHNRPSLLRAPFMSSSENVRQLVILCDGTNDNVTGKIKDTHVVTLTEWLTAHPDPLRTTFYDPGVGNPGQLPGSTFWDQIRRTMVRLQGLQLGRRVYENMAECYLFLMQHYQPGCEIYLFGFSRGAFTARSVAGLINQFGLLAPHRANMVPTLLHIYFSDRRPTDQWNAVAEQAARLFTDASTRKVPVHFVGVWETVANVGLPPFHAKIPVFPRAAGKQVVHVRHALALDEHRMQFSPRLYADKNGPFLTANGTTGDIMQLWFAGSHCDVGGGYPVDRDQLSAIPLAWLVNEAVACGLRVAPWVNTETRPPVVNSQLKAQPLWALTGLAVRNPRRMAFARTATIGLKPQSGPTHSDHPPLTFARNAAWVGARSSWKHRLCLLSLPFWLLMMGHALLGPSATGPSSGAHSFLLSQLMASLQATSAFQHWQLTAWLQPSPGLPLAAFTSPVTALLWDLGLIAAYTYGLSWWTCKAFAQAAGLRTVNSPPATWLNALGLALPVAVFSDLLENFFSVLAIGLINHHWEAMGRSVLVLVALASGVKWIGLVGLAVLLVIGLLRLQQLSRQR